MQQISSHEKWHGGRITRTGRSHWVAIVFILVFVTFDAGSVYQILYLLIKVMLLIIYKTALINSPLFMIPPFLTSIIFKLFMVSITREEKGSEYLVASQVG